MPSFSQPQSSLHHDLPSTLPPISSSQPDRVFDDNESESDFSITDIKNEQKIIDSTLKHLLNSPVPIKPKRGRPPSKQNKQEANSKLPDTISETLKSVENIKDLHGGILLDYLIKINKLNKVLVNKLDILNNKCKYLTTKVETIEQSTEGTSLNNATPVTHSRETEPVIDLNSTTTQVSNTMNYL